MLSSGAFFRNRNENAAPRLFELDGSSVESEVWRPIHYLGSKLRLVETIRELLDQLDPDQGRVCDLFSGSGTVAFALGQDRDVVAGDIQEYSRTLVAALLEPVPSSGIVGAAREEIFPRASEIYQEFTIQLEPLLDLEREALGNAEKSPELLCDIVESGSLECSDRVPANERLKNELIRARKCLSGNSFDRRMIATRLYGGSYFGYAQALWLDAISESFIEADSQLRTIGMAAVLSTASEIVNTVGKQFAQPIRPRGKTTGEVKRHLVSKMVKDRTLDVRVIYGKWLDRYLGVQRTGSHRVIRSDFRHVLKYHCSDVSVVYADPPYTRDHYSRFYHVLETLCLRDNPTIATTLLSGSGSKSRGMYREDRHQSPFCIKSEAPGAFDDLFCGVKRLGVPLVCSYSPYLANGHPRLMTIEAILGLAKSHFGNVEMRYVSDVSHSKLNKSDVNLQAAKEAEVFIVCR